MMTSATNLSALGRAHVAAHEHALTGMTTRHVQTTSKARATLAGTPVLTLKHGGAGNGALS